MGTLVGGVAHELNNPLTAIKSFAELMLLDARTPEDADALETMRREAHRAARIVSDLRLVARATQDDQGQTRQTVELNDVVRHVVKLRRYVLETNNVRIEEQLDPASPRVLGDRGQLVGRVDGVVNSAGGGPQAGVLFHALPATRIDEMNRTYHEHEAMPDRLPTISPDRPPRARTGRWR